MREGSHERRAGSWFRNLHYAIEPLFFVARDWLSAPETKLDEVGIRSGWQVLDFGCGIGSHTIAAAKIVGSHGTVYAVDVNPERVKIVESRANREALNNIKPIVTNCQTLVLDDSIDAVLLCDVFHALEHPARVLAELARVLKPEGILWFSDHHMSEAQAVAELTKGGLFELACREKLTYVFKLAQGRV